MQLDILRWVLLRCTIQTIYHPCVIFRMSADHNYLSLFFWSFPTFTVMACLIDVQVVVLLTCFQKLTARVETWKLIPKKCGSDDAIDQFHETWTGTSSLPIFLAAFYTRVGIFIFSQSVTGNTSLCMLFTIVSFHPFFSWNFRTDIKEMARHEWQPKELHLVNLLGWLCYFLNLLGNWGISGITGKYIGHLSWFI